MLRRLSMILALCLALVVVGGGAASAAMNTKNWEDKQKHNEFIQLCSYGSASEVQAALAKGANPNTLGWDGTGREAWGSVTPLGAATYWNEDKPEVANILLKAGADVNARDTFGETALMRIVYDKKYLGMVNLLLKAGADVNARGGNGKARGEGGRTALMVAASNSAVEMVDILLKAGADVNVRDKKGKTALSLATDPEVIAILKKAGAKE